MPKRSAAEAQNVDRARFVKTTKDDTPQVEDEDGVGEYEDPWEDEVESDEGEDKNQDDGSSTMRYPVILNANYLVLAQQWTLIPTTASKR